MMTFFWRMLVCLFVLIISGCQYQGPESLWPFTTDGCSNFPDGSLYHKKLWLNCCVAHDLQYWSGGTYEERLQADEELLACVKSVGEPAIANMMLAGVRVGGSPWWPTRFRWGYGWPYTHGYRALTPAEMDQVVKMRDTQISK